MLTLRLQGIPPSKKNEHVRCTIKSKKTGKLHTFIAPTKRYKLWEQDAALSFRCQAAEKGILKGTTQPVIAWLHYCCKDKRSWDLSNKTESIIDALVVSRLIGDDNRFSVRSILQDWEQVETDGDVGVSVHLIMDNQAEFGILQKRPSVES